MACVDPPHTSIHPPVKFENPDMEYNIQTLKLLISILRPFVRFLSDWHIEDDNQELIVRLKHMDDVVQKVIQEFFQPLAYSKSSATTTVVVQLVFSNLNILKSLLDEIDKIDDLRFRSDVSVSSKSAKHVVSFVDSLLVNLKDIFVCRADAIVPMKKEIEDVKERLLLMRNFLWLIEIFIGQNNVKDVFSSAQILAVKMSYLLLAVCMMNDEKMLMVSCMKGVLPYLVDEIDTLQMEIIEIYEIDTLQMEFKIYVTPTMDEHVLEFADYVVHKLRQMSGNEGPCFLVSAKDLVDILVDELSFLRFNLMNILFQNPVNEMKSLIISTQALIFKTGLFICKSSKTKEDKQMAEYCCFKLPDLLKAVENIKQQASSLFNKFFSGRAWKSNCLSTNVLEYANFLINKLDELLRSEEAAPLNAALKHQIETAYEEIVSVRKFLLDIAAHLGNSQMEFVSTKYKDAACQAEFVIDSFLAGEGSTWCHELGIFVVTKDVKILHKEVKSLVTMMMTSDSVRFSSGTSSQANEPSNNNATAGSKNDIHNRVEEAANELVGLNDAEAKIIELLTGGSRHLKTLSIVGMPGLGKTTLANSVYMHPSINFHFHVRAWCRVSQVYEKETLLFEIFGQIVGKKTNQNHESSEEDFAQKLYQNLKGRKFLIVIDDIWDIKAWNDLKETFPDDENGSRILFTTRHRGVALEANSIPYALRLLSPKESCSLLWLKLFDGETCPPELLAISKLIASNCKGLPLAVVLIAGILKKIERKTDCWERFAITLTRSVGIREKYLDVLEFSYKHLPACLKPCFLYFGTFPQDTTISASKLIQLWICEGFVLQPNQGQKSLEQEAESYLDDLIDRSLVMIARKSSLGAVKTCRVHDLLREFCSAKLEEESSVMRELIFGGIAILYGDFKMRFWNRFPIVSAAKMPRVRSLSYYHYKSQSDVESKGAEDISKQVVIQYLPPRNGQSISETFGFKDFLPICKGSVSESNFMDRLPVFGHPRQLYYGFFLQYELIRVLDLGSVRVQSSADTSDLVNIAKLIHLRYLAIRVRTTEIPSEIGNLQNLETFLLSGTIGRVILPEAVWNLVSLRHLLTYHSFFSFQHYSQEFFDNFILLDNLKSISALSLQNGSDVERILRRLPSTQKLGCIFSNSWDYSTGCNLFPVLEFLSKLESLKVFFSGKALYPCRFSFPSNLKKLSMSNFHLPWNEISIIGRLPNLEVLKLLNKAFEGQQWEMREGEFKKLKFLKLDSLDIELWDVSSEHLPCLEQLVVLRCQQLEEIPSSFGEICTLQLIEMKWCSSSATDSVKQILQEQRDMSNDQLNLIVVGPLI